MLKAVAVLDRTSTGKANVAAAPKKSGAGGPVTFSQDSQDCQARNGLTRVRGSLHGLTPGPHALIVHKLGDIRLGWVSTGIYGPFDYETPFERAGNDGVIAIIIADHNGTALFDVWTKVDLSGDDSVKSRGLVVHAGSNPGEGEAWGKYAKLIIRITLILFCILIYASRVIVRRQSLLADSASSVTMNETASL
ncbi:superoxide dismutase [Cu-Zn]-like [Citrus sinensis]|uniref:superoxide dismutase [Cu-Zn]-like n=1 Tax=Citrus sinensis TaxID=2711 RepID=UPI00227844E0|nr:superoxide dismutase [Cu-Zn]-like [Citrus sinensis]